jgi:hypothetical protein
MATSARRGHGEASVYRDAANGTWVGAVSLSWGPDGTRIRRKVTGRTKTEVRDKLKKLQAETDAGLKTSASYTLRVSERSLGPRHHAASASHDAMISLSSHAYPKLIV